MPVRIKLSKAGDRVERQELVLDQDLISIGRESSSAIPLAGSLVSKRHARIQRRGGAYCVVDLKSTNSTFLNGERLVPDREYPLHEGDLVRVANFDLEVLSLEGPGVPAPGAAAEGPQTMAAVSTLLREAGISPAGGREPAGNRLPAEELKAAGGAHVSPGIPRAVLILNVLLELLVKLSSGRASFLSEFMARSVVQTGEGGPARFPSVEDAIRHYTDPSLSDEEFALRLKELETTADALILHVMGLLEGYRKSVEDGSRRMLGQLSPELLRREPAGGGGPGSGAAVPVQYRLLPVLLDLKLYHLIERHAQELLREDRGGLERRFFRPGFIQGYETYTTEGGR